MQVESPDFMEWIIANEKGWTIKDDAPDWVQGALDKFNKDILMVKPIQ